MALYGPRPGCGAEPSRWWAPRAGRNGVVVRRDDFRSGRQPVPTSINRTRGKGHDRYLHLGREATLYLDRFETPDGRAALGARPYLPPGEQPDAMCPMILVTARRLEHYNAGTMTRRTANLALLPSEHLDLNRADAARLDVRDGTEVVVSSRRGRIQVGVQLTDEVLPGQVFLAFHFPDAAVNELTSGWTDDVTSCPEYMVTAVSVQPA
jgi:formate dehydrogenase major subunit